MIQLKNIFHKDFLVNNLPIILIIILFFVTRLIHLKIIPIFTDEAIYSYWSQVALHDPANRFISLEDGKQPLFIWIAAIFQKFINDPLIASRLVSVAAGFGSLMGIFFLTKTIFNDKTAKIAALLYVVLPFTIIYDRMALFDSLLTMLGIYSVILLIKLARYPRLDLAIIAGFIIGLSLITKSSGIFFLYLLPFSLIFFDYKNKNAKLNFLKWLGGSLLVFAISQSIYNLLRLSPLFYVIARKNLEFIRTTSDLLQDPFKFAYSNFLSITGWLTTYIGWPLFIIFIVGLLLTLIKKSKEAVFLLVYILAPFTAELLFNKVLYPRFALFYFPYLIIIISYAANYFFESIKKNNWLIYAFFTLTLSIPVFTSVNLLTNPKIAKIASSDAGQYLNDWPSGFGVEQIIKIVKNESKIHNVYIGTEGTFGLLPYAFQIYFFGDQKAHFIGFWPVNPDELPQQILDIAKNNKTYFVFNENQNEIVSAHLKFIEKYQKGNGNSFMRLYQVIP